MPKYDERIDPIASLSDSMELTHMTEEAKHKLSNVFSSIFTDNTVSDSNEHKLQ
jgi:uncharacterized protein YfkK (UPF0435 family)